jgi:acetyl-CoA carboxylase beta subunit
LISCLLLTGCQTTIFVDEIEKAMKVCEAHQGLYKIVKDDLSDGYRVTCKTTIFVDEIEKAMKVCEAHQGLYKIVKGDLSDGYRVTCIDNKYFDTKMKSVLEEN